jgi:UDP-N-acetyl-D-galactosamine dehydrogenase
VNEPAIRFNRMGLDTQAVGHHPEMILAGRRLNDAMGAHVAHEVVKGKTQHEDYGATVAVHDRVVGAEEAQAEFGLNLVLAEALAQRARTTATDATGYDAAILAVGHRPLVQQGARGIQRWLKPAGYLYDVKYALPAHAVDGRL